MPINLKNSEWKDKKDAELLKYIQSKMTAKKSKKALKEDLVNYKAIASILDSYGVQEFHYRYWTANTGNFREALERFVKLENHPEVLVEALRSNNKKQLVEYLMTDGTLDFEQRRVIAGRVAKSVLDSFPDDKARDDFMHDHMLTHIYDDQTFRNSQFYLYLMADYIGRQSSNPDEWSPAFKDYVKVVAYGYIIAGEGYKNDEEQFKKNRNGVVDRLKILFTRDAEKIGKLGPVFNQMTMNEMESFIQGAKASCAERNTAWQDERSAIKSHGEVQTSRASAGSRRVGQPQMVQVDDGMTPAARKQRGVAELDEVEELNEGLAESEDNDVQEQVKNNRTTLSVLRKNLDKMIQSANKFTAFMAHIDGLKKTIMTRLNRSAMQREAQPVSYQVNGVTKQNLGILNLPYSTGELAEATMLMQGPLDSDAQKNALVEAMAGKQLHFDDSTRTVTVEILGQSGRTILLSEGYYPLALRAQLIISLGRMQSTSDDDEYEQHAKAAMDACKRMMQYLEKGETLPHVMITDDFTNFVNHDEIFLAVYHAAYPDLSDDKVVDNVQMYQNMFKKAIESNASASAAATAPAAGAAQTQQTEIQKGNKRMGFFGFGANKKGQKTAKTESKQVVATASAGEGAKREDKGKSELTEPKRALQRELEEALKKQRRSDGVSGGNSTRPK